MYLAAELLVESLAESCVITMDKNRSLIYDRHSFVVVPVYQTRPRDVFEAGATYLGGFASGFLEGCNAAECGSLGAAAGSQRTENSGLGFSLTRSEVEKRAAQIAHGISIK